MRIALDAMGGDHAPHATVDAAVRAADEGLRIVLVGDEAVLDEELKVRGGLPDTLQVRHAPEVVEMDDAPGAAFRRKKESSLRVAFELARTGQVDGVVTMGNSGAALAAGMFVSGRLPGVLRPAITALLPGRSGPVALLDVGANTECRPDHLEQFGLMGATLARTAWGLERPRVAVLSNGEEEEKGTELTRAAALLLRRRPEIDFLGYLEPRMVLENGADVVVTDGWTGNILLKTAEGVVGHVGELLRGAAEDGPAAKAGAWLMRGALRRTLGRLVQAETMGGLLLGIDTCAVIGHGRSDEQGVLGALRFAARLARADLVGHLRDAMAGPAAAPVGLAGPDRAQ